MTTTSGAESEHQVLDQDPPPPVRGTVRRLIGWAAPLNFVTFAIFTAVPSVLVPTQVETIDNANKIVNLAVITTVGAIAAMLAQPLAGLVSDRTRTRFGRRAPWMVLGSLVTGLALIGTGLANTLVQIGISLVILQVAIQFATGPFYAVLPDRIPARKRGTYSSLAGLGVALGALGGQVIASSFVSHILVGYVFLAGLLIVVFTLFVVFNPDHSSRGVIVPRLRIRDLIRAYWVNPIQHPDFFWAFLGRILLYGGYILVSSYQLYILQDYIGLKGEAVHLIPLFGLITLPSLIVATILSGMLSDRLKRRKIFVLVASALVAIGVLLPAISPTVGGWIGFSAIAAFGFGIFQAVDQALMSEVLPSASTYGKDLGVVNIAATLPQVLAPGVAGLLVLAFGGYFALFPAAIMISLAGAFAVLPIKSVR